MNDNNQKENSYEMGYKYSNHPEKICNLNESHSINLSNNKQDIIQNVKIKKKDCIHSFDKVKKLNDFCNKCFIKLIPVF